MYWILSNIFFSEKLERGYECHEVDTSNYDLSTAQTSLFFKLAKEVVASILVYVNIDDLVAFSMVCRQFKQWSDMSHIWNLQISREFGIEAKSQNPKKEIATMWHTQVNMRKGRSINEIFLLTHVKLEVHVNM